MFRLVEIPPGLVPGFHALCPRGLNRVLVGTAASSLVSPTIAIPGQRSGAGIAEGEVERGRIVL